MEQEDPAWIHYRKIFSEVYDESNYSSPLQRRVMRASHDHLERAFGPDVYFGRVIEVGAGTGEHILSVRHRFDRYLLTDLEQKTLDVAKSKLRGMFGGELSFEVQSAADLRYPDSSFDRLIAVHVLEHIYQPHLAIKEWIRVINDGGMLSILIPTDPGIAWRLGRHFGPRRQSLQKGVAYDYVMAREHVNSCNNLVALLRHYCPTAKESWWPLAIPSMDVNLFFAFHATVRK